MWMASCKVGLIWKTSESKTARGSWGKNLILRQTLNLWCQGNNNKLTFTKVLRRRERKLMSLQPRSFLSSISQFTRSHWIANSTSKSPLLQLSRSLRPQKIRSQWSTNSWIKIKMPWWTLSQNQRNKTYLIAMMTQMRTLKIYWNQKM